MPGQGRASGWAPAVGAAVSVLVIFVAVLSLPLATADDLGLTTAEATGWILALYGVPSVLTLVLVLRFRQPLLLTGNVFVLIFITRLGGDLTWAELVGAAVVAGVLVLVVGVLGLTDRLVAWLPAPVVFGLLAGAVLPFLVELFTALSDDVLVVGAVLVTYLVARALMGERSPAILPALVVGAVVAAVEPGYASPDGVTWPRPTLTAPAWSWSALLTATPVMVVLITLQANVPSVVFLRVQGYRPPEAPLTLVSGVGTAVGSLLGPMGISLSLPATALCAGPDVGDVGRRHRAAAIVAAGGVVIALLAGLAVQVAQVVPASLLTALVGLAVLSVAAAALQRVSEGPLRLGPLVAFAVALSDLRLLGLGPFFWALALGVGASLLVEREALASLRGRTAARPSERVG